MYEELSSYRTSSDHAIRTVFCWNLFQDKFFVLYVVPMKQNFAIRLPSGSSIYSTSCETGFSAIRGSAARLHGISTEAGVDSLNNDDIVQIIVYSLAALGCVALIVVSLSI